MCQEVVRRPLAKNPLSPNILRHPSFNNLNVDQVGEFGIFGSLWWQDPVANSLELGHQIRTRTQLQRPLVVGPLRAKMLLFRVGRGDQRGHHRIHPIDEYVRPRRGAVVGKAGGIEVAATAEQVDACVHRLPQDDEGDAANFGQHLVTVEGVEVAHGGTVQSTADAVKIRTVSITTVSTVSRRPRLVGSSTPPR